MNHRLECQNCHADFDPGLYPFGCPTCHSKDESGRLEVTFSSSIEKENLTFEDKPRVQSMWRYQSLLPLLPEEPVSLGEGGTPLIETESLAQQTGVKVMVKNETVNPTWSFKDRLNSLLLSNALELGAMHIATSSTGNHGASTAAYASRGGAESVVVLVPNNTEEPLKLQIKAYGANVVATEFDSRRELLLELVERGWFPTVSVTKDYASLPYGLEAYKTIAFELFDQLGEPPDAIMQPIGAGDGLYGIWKGFRELKESGMIESVPRMIGVQPAERPSVVTAIESGESSVPTVEGPMPITTSVGGSSAGNHALRAIEESAGGAVAIEKETVLKAMRDCGHEAILVEPASALGAAAIPQAHEEGFIDRGELAVWIATGAGIKWPRELRRALGPVEAIEPTIQNLEATLQLDTER